MDYKEKYENALEKAREYNNVYKDHTMMSYAKGALEDIFPELAESEDEKIRKAIMALIEWSKSYSASGITNDDAKKMLAWLEKQGEQKPLRMVSAEAKEAMYDKPADTVEPKFKVGDRVRYKGHMCEGIITEITDTDYICGNAKLPISTQDKLELIEQKPAEWTEQDEKMFLKTMRDYETVEREWDVDKKTERTWLKSLKGRVKPQWKPSETDVTILEDVFNGKINPKDFQATLLNVLEQLKKLKEEQT